MWPLIDLGLGFYLPSYPTVISIAMVVGFLWVSRRAMQWQIRREDALDTHLAMGVGAFLGGRLYHVLLEHPRWYLENPQSIFMFWRGGFVFFGGILGATCAFFVMTRIRKFPWVPMIECLLPVLSLQMILGRLACFMAGCCYGRPTALPWGIHFPPGSLAPTDQALHPTQIYSALLWLALTVILIAWERRRILEQFLGRRLAFFFFSVGLGRFFIEFLRNDDRGDFVGPLSQAQVISIISAAFGIGLWVWIRRHPDMVLSWKRRMRGEKL